MGEGTFGEVKLLVNKENGEACAMKEVGTSLGNLSPHSSDRP